MGKGLADTTKFDPNRTPFSSPAPRFTYIDLPLYGTLMVNSDTKEIVKIPGGEPLPAVPLRLPAALMEVPQPNVRTCGVPGEKVGQGCTSALRGGCAIYNQYGRVGPCNVIIEKYGRIDSVPCHLYYAGLTASGLAAHGAAYVLNGWRVLTDRTFVEFDTRDTTSKTKRNIKHRMEVDNLAPFYNHLKPQNGEAPKKKRGRPKKVEAA
jgi:hypothetical protein